MTLILKDDGLVSRLRGALLDWYDRDGRRLPWREGGRDPYRVWLSEVMLQQTTVPHAAPYYEKFLGLWPTVHDLAAAPDEDVMAQWAGLGYYSRARNLIKCARVVVSDFDGVFPDSESDLLKLPGFGPYTAAAVAAIAFDRPANVVDGNIERIMARLYAVETPVPAARPTLREAAAQWVRADRAGDWPQALMDLATAICRPKSPTCMLCTLAEGCDGRAGGNPERYPVKLAKAAKPRRYGTVWVMLSGDQVIVERRPDKGLLGGMLGLPHSDWIGEPVNTFPPVPAAFTPAGEYEHVFTHFALTQEVRLAQLDAAETQAALRQHNDWHLMPVDAGALPTVFAKALKRACATSSS